MKLIARTNGRSPNTARKAPRGFTLIELLVVVAIIAMLISILLPSMSRAREQAKMMTCATKIRSLVLAFNAYAVDNKGLLPGANRDKYADWGGRCNVFDPARPGDVRGVGYFQNGTIYRYVSKYDIKDAIICPSQNWMSTGSHHYSYTSNVLLSGAPIEWLMGAHHPDPASSRPNGMYTWDRVDHRRFMKGMEGVPMLVEEFLAGNDTFMWISDSGWMTGDSITDRHMKSRGGGAGNVGYHDGHVARFRLPAGAIGDTRETGGSSKYFSASSVCIQMRGGKFVSGRYAENFVSTGSYGCLRTAPPADQSGVRHK